MRSGVIWLVILTAAWLPACTRWPSRDYTLPPRMVARPTVLDDPAGLASIQPKLLYYALMHLTEAGCPLSQIQRGRLLPLLRTASTNEVSDERVRALFVNGTFSVLTSAQKEFARAHAGQAAAVPMGSSAEADVLRMLTTLAGPVLTSNSPPKPDVLTTPMAHMQLLSALLQMERSPDNRITTEQARRLLPYVKPYVQAVAGMQQSKRDIVAVLTVEQKNYVAVLWGHRSLQERASALEAYQALSR